MTIAKKIETILASASWIRRMFEEGAELKKKYGSENVYDFSLGAGAIRARHYDRA